MFFLVFMPNQFNLWFNVKEEVQHLFTVVKRLHIISYTVNFSFENT